jgi:hypothetical protein
MRSLPSVAKPMPFATLSFDCILLCVDPFLRGVGQLVRTIGTTHIENYGGFEWAPPLFDEPSTSNL